MDIKTLHDADIIGISTAKSAFDTLATAFGQHIENSQGELIYEHINRPGKQAWFGTDPASGDFGGQRFSVANGTITDSHDDYFGKHDAGGDSLPNIGKLVSGHGNAITRQDPR
ncbi:hypothetical protein [Kitasatospora aureofaciens]|uniref:hypothetical protein n=1 Tax=Kitasatospora aureofaciens TaxID=1894 RepID=UPI0037C7282C